MQFISILGRQPELGVAELERLYGGDNVNWLSPLAAIIDTKQFDFNRLGGSQKAGQVITEIKPSNWHTISQQIVRHFTREWSEVDHKITLGISAYGFDNLSTRDIQKTGIVLKQKLKASSVSLRLLPNQELALNTASSHHNKLGLSPNKVELLIVRASNGLIVIAESIGAQNITALATRDQGRPKRDAYVGMLPPKLAQIMINLAGAEQFNGALWDPFCGTGVVLQEARLRGIDVYGSDISEKMVQYTTENMKWLDSKYALGHAKNGWMDSWWKVFQADATTVQIDKNQKPPIAYVVCETYLGQPFSAPPSKAKLTEVRSNCDHIIRSFLKNIGSQLKPGTPLCLAVPAWKDLEGNFTHLPLVSEFSALGYEQIALTNIKPRQLIYHRDDQVVARQLLIVKKV